MAEHFRQPLHQLIRISFPPGERFFVESVRHFRNQISDPTLKAQVAGFIGQKALHGREHDRLNTFLPSGS